LFVIETVLSSPCLPNVLDALFEVGGEVPIAHIERVFLDQVAHVGVALVDVADGLIGAVLAEIVAWVLESICRGCGQGSCGMSNINVLLCPLPKVSSETVQVVTLRHVNSGVLVVPTQLIHEENSHVFIVNVKH